MAKNTVNVQKVRDSIKSFLEKMKALDEDIPEELAQDALEMTEEVSDALACEIEDEDPDVLEITKDKDECKSSDEDIEKKVEDTMMKVFRKMGMIQDSAMKSLDAVEEELTKEEEETNTLDEDEDEDGKKSNDSMLSFIRKMKPVIASVKDSRQRKKLADELASFAKLNKTADYAGIMNTAKKNANDAMHTKKSTADADYDFGMDVAKKFNPHYKEEN